MSLFTLREAAKLTRQQVAHELQCSISAIQSWERGINVPTATKAAKLAKLYNVPAETILSLFADKKAAGHAVSFLNLAIAAAMLAVGLLAIELTMPALGSF